MKKKLIILLIAILTSIVCTAQTEEKVLIPVRVLNGIIDDLTKYDGMKITLSRKDSTITILNDQLKRKDEVILVHKLKQDEYKQIIENYEVVLKVKEAENKDLKKELRKVKIRNTLVIIAEAAIIVLLIL